MYTYLKSELGLWTVGHYDDANNWRPESDHNCPEEAADRCAYLNGGFKPETEPKALEVKAQTPQFIEVVTEAKVKMVINTAHIQSFSNNNLGNKYTRLFLKSSEFDDATILVNHTYKEIKELLSII